MSVLTLLDTLESLGVQVTVTPGGKLRLEPASLVPAATTSSSKNTDPHDDKSEVSKVSDGENALKNS